MRPCVATAFAILLVGAGAVVGIVFTAGIIRTDQTADATPEQLVLSNITFTTESIAVSIDNNGSSTVAIVQVLVNGISQFTIDPRLPIALRPNTDVDLRITMNVVSNEEYEIRIISSRGNFFSRQMQAPSFGNYAAAPIDQAVVSARI